MALGFFSRLKEVPKEQKKDAGDALNKLRDRIESELKEKQERVAAEESKRKESRDVIDVTLPARLPVLGGRGRLQRARPRQRPRRHPGGVGAVHLPPPARRHGHLEARPAAARGVAGA